MSKATVNVGAAPDDGTGDTLRAAFVKIQANFDELYNLPSGSIVVGAGAGGAPLTYSGFTFNGSTLAIAMGTITTAIGPQTWTETRNSAGTTFPGLKYTITDTASAAGSLAMQILGGASGTTNLLSLDKSGALQTQDGSASAPVIHGTNTTNSGFYYSGASPAVTVSGSLVSYWSSLGVISQVNAYLFGTAVSIYSPADAQIRFGGSTPTSTTGALTIARKSVTAFTDGVAKTVFTLTIPNAAHSASYLVRVTGSIGAGGAIGANEASATNCYVVTICRTAGVNAVAGISAAFGASTAAVAGATTVTCTAALAAVSGAVGATNTIDIQATITKGGGASDNHTCVATASLLNANATGVTIA